MITKILILKEKHGDYYFDASTEEILHESALKILSGRMKSKYWYGECPKNDTDYAEKPSMSKEDIDKLSDGKIKNMAIKEHLEYNRGLKIFNREVKWFNAAEKAIAEKNGKLAWECLRDRRDGEYENIEIENVSIKYNG